MKVESTSAQPRMINWHRCLIGLILRDFLFLPRSAYVKKVNIKQRIKCYIRVLNREIKVSNGSMIKDTLEAKVSKRKHVDKGKNKGDLH